MDKLSGSIDSVSDSHAGGMGSNPGGGMIRERNEKAGTDMNAVGWFFGERNGCLTSVILIEKKIFFIPNSECKWKGQSKEFRGMQESIPKVDQ